MKLRNYSQFLQSNYKIVIDECVKDSSIVKNLPRSFCSIAMTSMGYRTGSKYIVLTARKDNFVEKYNYGNGIVDLNEYVIRFINQCVLRCRYCYLQDTKEPDEIKIYINFEKLEDEIKQLRKNIKGRIYFNAGENADSLLFDPLFNISKYLIDIISRIDDVYLELRTKTNNIEELLKTEEGRGKIIVSFSLAPQEIIKKYEILTCNLEKRIAAMKVLSENNFLIGLRFEPIVNIKNLEESYYQIFKKLSKILKSENLHSISFGCIRFTQGLIKNLSKDRIGYSLLLDEIVKCPDKKYRYFRKIRVGIYKKLIRISRTFFSNTPIFLSFEPEYIWNDCGLTLLTISNV